MKTSFLGIFLIALIQGCHLTSNPTRESPAAELPGVSVDSSLTPSPKAASTNQEVPPSSGSDLSSEQILQAINCKEMIPAEIEFKCPEKQLGHFFPNLSSKIRSWSTPDFTDIKLNAEVAMTVYEVPDQLVRSQLRAGYQTWQTLDQTRTFRIYQVAESGNKLFVKREVEGSPGMMRDDYSDYWTTPRESPGPRNILAAFELLVWLHSQKFVAINFDTGIPKNQKSHRSSKLDKLSLVTKLGEEVGGRPLDPVLTDPRVFQSQGATRADPAMDFYALGIHVFRMMDESQFEPKAYDKVILGAKLHGSFDFDPKSVASLALWACYLLQDNVEARSNLQVLRQVVKLAANDMEMAPLGQPFTYNPKDDPLSLPIFKNLVDRLVLPQAASSRISTWLVISILGLLGVAVMVGVVWVFGRKTNPQQTNEAQQNLDPDAPTDLTIRHEDSQK